MNSLWAVKQSINTSLDDYFERWQGKPQNYFKWALFFEEGREAQEYKIFELEQWDYVENKIKYLLATENHYAHPKKGQYTPEKFTIQLYNSLF